MDCFEHLQHLATGRGLDGVSQRTCQWAVDEIARLEATNDAFLKRIAQRDADQGRALLEIARLRKMRTELAYVVNYFHGGLMPLDLHDWRERVLEALRETK